MYFCRDFMLTIEIKEDPDDPKERARRAAAKRRQKEAEAMANNKAKIPVCAQSNLCQVLIKFDSDKQFLRRRHQTTCEDFQNGVSTWKYQQEGNTGGDKKSVSKVTYRREVFLETKHEVVQV